MRHARSLTLLILSLAALLVLPASAADDRVAEVYAKGSVLVFEPTLEFDTVQLTVRGPKRTLTQDVFPFGRAFVWDALANDVRRPDGAYTFHLQVQPLIDKEARELVAASREKGNEDEVFVRLCEERRLPAEPITQSGYFHLLEGQVILGGPAEEEGEKPPPPPDIDGRLAARGRDVSAGLEVLPEADFVILDDLIVDGSACIGFDCVNGESFGFDTIRLKENNLRIKFDDTSTAASYPRNDWQLTANDSANGGASKFSIDDISGGRTPFTVEASAPSNSLYVDDSGRVGFGTSTPYVELHTVDGDTPTVRLEQTGASGFAPQSWDVAGNETNFFVRDVTSGSTLPFRIRPGASSSSLYIDSDDDIGIGTASPSEDIHIVRNSVPVGVKLENSADGRDWSFKLSGSGFAINEESEASTLLLRDSGEMRVGNNGTEMMVLQTDGDLIIDGTLTENSNVHAKQDFQPVDPNAVLERLAALEVTTWSFKRDPTVRHMGPTAQDFRASFGLGEFEDKLAPVDVRGVTLAAVQALYQQLQNQAEQLDALRAENATLVERLTALETAGVAAP